MISWMAYLVLAIFFYIILTKNSEYDSDTMGESIMSQFNMHIAPFVIYAIFTM